MCKTSLLKTRLTTWFNILFINISNFFNYSKACPFLLFIMFFLGICSFTGSALDSFWFPISPMVELLYPSSSCSSKIWFSYWLACPYLYSLSLLTGLTETPPLASVDTLILVSPNLCITIFSYCYSYSAIFSWSCPFLICLKFWSTPKLLTFWIRLLDLINWIWFSLISFKSVSSL